MKHEFEIYSKPNLFTTLFKAVAVAIYKLCLIEQVLIKEVRCLKYKTGELPGYQKSKKTNLPLHCLRKNRKQIRQIIVKYSS